jgi:hypothetical protein
MKDRTRFAIALFAICLLGFALLACEFSIGGGEPSVEAAVMARSLDADYEPVETTNVFDPTDVFYCSVRVTDLEEDSVVTVRWFFGSEFLGEYTYLAEAGGSGYIGFNLSPAGTWLAGGYRADVYLNGALAQSATFSVVGAEPPPATPTVPVVEVPTPTEPALVMETPTPSGIDLGALVGGEGPSFSDLFFAAGVTDDDEPVDVATEFTGGTTVVYAFASYEGMSDGAQCESVWYLDDEEALRNPFDWVLGESGATWIANISSDSGLDPGRYDWELYVEEELTVTGGFVVEEKAAPPPPKPPTTAVLQGTIAFARWDQTQRYQIWTMSADGSNQKMLSDFASEPSFSPDGKRITFYAWEGTEGGNGLWIMNADGTAREVRRNDANVRFPRWSPDNKYIAFWNPPYMVNVYNLSDTSVRQVVDGEHPAWSPDAQRLAVKSCATGGGGCGLYTVGVDGGGKTPLTDNAEDGIPTWSPDGRQIAFICKSGETFDICMVNADGSGRQNLTSNNPEHDVNPAWLPDGSGIVFYSVREGKWGIYAMNADGSGVQKIIDADPGPDWGRGQISITP